MTKLLFYFFNINGEVIQLIKLPFKSIQSSTSFGNIFLVHGNATPGGVLLFSLTDDEMINGTASEILKNGTMHVGPGNMEHCKRTDFIH